MYRHVQPNNTIKTCSLYCLQYCASVFKCICKCICTKESNNHAYYQTLIKDGTANGATTSNAYLTSSYVLVKTKCVIMKYRTGTLYNQKHALFKLSTSQTCPLCPQVDSALHILSGCQHTQIRNMITERHNLACCMIFSGYQQNRLLRIMRFLHGYRQQPTDDHAKSPDS